MRNLLALLEPGTHGTQPEPARAPRGDCGKIPLLQTLNATGTLGALGTRETYQAVAFEAVAQRVADIADAYAERIALVLEAGDITEAEARRIAEAEIGAAFVRAFLPGEAAA